MVRLFFLATLSSLLLGGAARNFGNSAPASCQEICSNTPFCSASYCKSWQHPPVCQGLYYIYGPSRPDDVCFFDGVHNCSDQGTVPVPCPGATFSDNYPVSDTATVPYDDTVPDTAAVPHDYHNDYDYSVSDTAALSDNYPVPDTATLSDNYPVPDTATVPYDDHNDDYNDDYHDDYHNYYNDDD
ncbi:hypothetical protein FOZ62_020853 [Perkinsus olseni]|uniref:Uncharacterized protein n=1 Tax=Perkinsus olseni TaxID=32597 RepID=A0A7J6T1G7_PEROL|nr:hypothetical protein FOZ62_020853 [Perkinsus olseni]